MTPYAAGDTFTLADAAAFSTLPTVGNATRIIYGEDLVTAGDIDWKPYVKMLGERPSFERVNADRKRDTDALKAAVAAKANASGGRACKALTGSCTVAANEWSRPTRAVHNRPLPGRSCSSSSFD